MKVINLDKYTKFILTVIAIMLTTNVMIHLIPSLYAEAYNYSDVINVKIVGIDESPFELWEPIKVEIQ